MKSVCPTVPPVPSGVVDVDVGCEPPVPRVSVPPDPPGRKPPAPPPGEPVPPTPPGRASRPPHAEETPSPITKSRHVHFMNRLQPPSAARNANPGVEVED